MERINIFHIFDRILPASLTDIANNFFLFVAACQIFTHLYVHRTNLHHFYFNKRTLDWIYNKVWQ